MKYTIGSLFSGYGGIDYGLEQTGRFTTAWFSEVEPYPNEILKERWGVPNHGDITAIKWEAVERVDVLTGGFPCQDISNAGKRAGITGERSGLWKEYLQAISVLRPRVILAENVSALLGRGLDTVLCDLAAVGYDAEWYCVPAAAVGAPHRRDRVFIIAYPQGDGVEGGLRQPIRQAEPRSHGDARAVADTNRRRHEQQAEEVRPGRNTPHDEGQAMADTQGAGHGRGLRPDRDDRGRSVQEPTDSERPVVRSQAEGRGGVRAEDVPNAEHARHDGATIGGGAEEAGEGTAEGADQPSEPAGSGGSTSRRDIPRGEQEEVADASSERLGEEGRLRTGREERATRSGEEVADADHERQQHGGSRARPRPEDTQRHSLRQELELFRSRGYWAVEPDIRRVVDGPAYGMDDDQYKELVDAVGEKEAKKIASYAWKARVKACGNGVVPQVAEFIGGIVIRKLEEQDGLERRHED